MLKQLAKFFQGEFINLSIGYLAGLVASNLVSRYFVKKGLANLWGLTAKKQAVTKDTYEWLMFFSSYLIGLIVLVLVSFLMQKLRKEEAA